MSAVDVIDCLTYPFCSPDSAGEVAIPVDLPTWAPITLSPTSPAWIGRPRPPSLISLNTTSITSKPILATSTRLRLPTGQRRLKPDLAAVAAKTRRRVKVSSRQFLARCNPALCRRRCRRREAEQRSHHSFVSHRGFFLHLDLVTPYHIFVACSLVSLL